MKEENKLLINLLIILNRKKFLNNNTLRGCIEYIKSIQNKLVRKIT